MDAYAKYKDARDAAWRVLLDCHITRLPVDLTKIANQTGIRIVKNTDADELGADEAGICFRYEGVWYIIYDDTMPSKGRIRYTVAHEMGHIFLGHALSAPHHTRTYFAEKPISEAQADMFAARLLAPACVIWGLRIFTAEEIASVCGISAEAARYRAQRISELIRRNRFLSHPLEREVFERFRPFILENRK